MLERQSQTISRTLTWMNMLVSGTALLLACTAFIAYDLVTFRANMARNLSTQAQIIGSNTASALLFNDQQSAENTLSALKASPDILSASIYTPDGRLFATYSRDQAAQVQALPAIPSRGEKSTGLGTKRSCWSARSCFEGSRLRLSTSDQV
jgi:uncharacterized membrane protein affecting hemolysin expression